MNSRECTFYREDLLKIADIEMLGTGQPDWYRELSAIDFIKRFQDLSSENIEQLTALKREINRENVAAFLKKVRAQ